MNEVTVKKSINGQFGKKVFAKKIFMKGEVVITYSLESLSLKEFEELTKRDKKFTHTHRGRVYLYSTPERYVNHSTNPNTNPDTTMRYDVAIRTILEGEEITTDSTKDDV